MCGQFSEEDGIARINGKLSVARALGDIEFRQMGLIADADIKSSFVD